MLNNVRLSIRKLSKNPGFSAIAILVLALGIGANTTIFSIINSMLLRPIQVRHPEQLVGIYQHDTDSPDSFNLFSYPDFTDLRDGRDAVFSELIAFGIGSVGFQGEFTERIAVNFVSANFFSALGVTPTLGRGFLPEDEVSGTSAAVLSHSLWERLGSDPLIVGKTFNLTRGNITVVGVMPDGFTGILQMPTGMFLPTGMMESLNFTPGEAPQRILTNRGDRRFMLIGRLNRGLTLENVEGPLSVLNHRLLIPDPAAPKARTLICTVPARFSFGNAPDRVGKEIAPVASLAFGLSLLVLLIACLNLANMMLARGAARQKEFAVRLALGAGRGRILGQLLTEGLLLAMLGGAGGLFISVWVMRLLTTFVRSSGLPADFPKFDPSPDWRILATLFLVSGIATLLFALGPAWKLARLDLSSDLKRHAETRQELRKGWFGLRDILAVSQMAFALTLLVAAALFSRSAINAARANPGFEFGSNFYVSLDTTLTGYSEERARELIRKAIEQLSGLPGVESVSAAKYIPFGESSIQRGVQRGGAAAQTRGGPLLPESKDYASTYNVVGAGYFRTLGIPLERGREFNRAEAETTNAQPVAIISRKLADQLWPGEDPLGRSIQFPNQDTPPRLMTIVGIAPAVHWTLFDEQVNSEVYVPTGQDFQTDLKLHVRIAPGANAAALMTAARNQLLRLDARIPLTEIKTLEGLHTGGMTMRTIGLGSILFGAFGLLATLLAMLGLYGLKAYSIARRTREIGIRMALGANRWSVVTMLLRETGLFAGVGLGAGLILSLAVGKFARGFLYQVPSFDPLTFSVIPMLLLAVTFIACVIPARRATRINPMKALRCD